jgi:hypothetical protein
LLLKGGRFAFVVVVFFGDIIFGLLKVHTGFLRRGCVVCLAGVEDADGSRWQKLERDTLLCSAIEGRQSGRFGGRSQK